MDIWPGFSTSINLFEKSILLQADISHKILRSDTVLSTLYELYSSNRSNFKIAAEKKFIGQIVLTRYIFIKQYTIYIYDILYLYNAGTIIKHIKLMILTGIAVQRKSSPKGEKKYLLLNTIKTNTKLISKIKTNHFLYLILRKKMKELESKVQYY